ncbi:MAG: response regulator [Planctomycetota bacterium]|nr:MAG: response regulator [Planctomycetota bacterium]
MKTIFVVEEDDSSRNLLWELLTQRKDHTVHVVKDADTALRALEGLGNQVDLLITGLELEFEGGVPFLTYYRGGYPSTDIIAFTRKMDSELARDALDQGVVFVLPRPIDISDLLEKVNYVLGRRKTRIWTAAEIMKPDVVKEDWMELTAPADMEFVERFRHFTEMLYQTNLPEDVKSDLRIAINEFGQNAVEWGNRGDTDKRIHLLYCVFEDRIMLKIEDEGEGFDLESLEDPTAEPVKYQRKRESEGKRVGGYGIFIVKNLMDQVIFNKKGNVVIMTKFLPREPAAPDDGGANRK